MSSALMRLVSCISSLSSCPVLTCPVVSSSFYTSHCLSFSLLPSSRHTVILADSIRNYMSKFLSDAWMYENGFVDEKVHQFPAFISTSSLRLQLSVPPCLRPIFRFSASFLSASFIYGTFFLFICHLHLFHSFSCLSAMYCLL
jgi:hypothetical protein